MTNQDSRLLEFLKANHSIDPLVAWKVLGIYRLSACIHRLRHNHHHPISTQRRNITNSFGEKCSVAEYILL